MRTAALTAVVRATTKTEATQESESHATEAATEATKEAATVVVINSKVLVCCRVSGCVVAGKTRSKRNRID